MIVHVYRELFMARGPKYLLNGKGELIIAALQGGTMWGLRVRTMCRKILIAS